MDLARAFAPSAVTIVGASSRSTHTRYLIDNLRRPACRFAGALNLVNRSAAVIDGIASVASTAEIDGDPGLVVLLIPAPDCVAALSGFDRTPQGVVVFAGGAESGFAAEQEHLRAWAVEHDVPLFGPQSTGIASFHAPCMAVIAPMRAEPRPGGIALIMQSAGLLGGALNSFFQREIGLHSVASIGNASVVSFADLARHFLGQQDVRALGMYLDAIGSVEDLVVVARAARERDVAVALLVGGSSEAGRAAVQSHTGLLATPRRIIEGVAKQFGIVLVADTDELVWALEAFQAVDFTAPPAGGVALIASSGGAGILMADALSSAGVALAVPGDDSRAALSRARPVTTFNPFDAGAASLDDPEALRHAVTTFARDPAFSMIVSVAAAGLPAESGMEAHLRQSSTFVESARAAGALPLLIAPYVQGSGAGTRPPARWPGVPVASGAKEATAKIRALWLWANQSALDPAASRSAAIARPGAVEVQSGLEAQRVLRSLAARWPREVLVPADADARTAIAGLRYPLVAKAEAGLAHRAASGGVLLGIADAAGALAAIEYLRARFHGGVALIEQIAHGDELVLGYQRHPAQGPLLMFGKGGTGVGNEVEFRAAPLGRHGVAAIVASYASGADRDALIAALLSLQPIVQDDARIVSVDLNPIVVVGGEVVVLDAKVHRAV